MHKKVILMLHFIYVLIIELEIYPNENCERELIKILKWIYDSASFEESYNGNFILRKRDV